MKVNKGSGFIRKYLRSVSRRRKALKVLYVAGFVAILLIGGWYWYSQSRETYVPQEFYNARGRAAEISSRIVQLTDASVVTLGQISAADEKGDYKRGLELVNQELERNSEIKIQAFKLSEELKAMLLNLGAVKPDRAVEVGLQATTSGLELAQRLVTYNGYAQELFAVLQTRLEKNGTPRTRQRIEQIILRMNEEAEAVNNLNNQYQEQMKDFDRLTGR